MNKLSLMKVAFGLACVLILTAFPGCPPKSGNLLAKKIQEVLGEDVKEYQGLSYPTNSFGVATSYNSPESGKPVSDADFVCATWKCLGIDSSSSEPKDQKAQLVVSVGGVEYAQIGSGGSITLSSDEASQYAFTAMLPKIEGVLNLGGGLDAKSVTKVELQMGRATKRFLGKPDFIAYLNGVSSPGPTKQALQTAFSQGGLSVVVADVVLDSIVATITTSSELGSKIDAKLGGVASAVFSDAETSFKVTKANASTYKVETTGPVVAMRLIKKQPGQGALAEDKDWKEWVTISSLDPSRKTTKK
ncbi:MAG: hypothetical protein Q7K57_54630 [Burkholderiaceae bacterium]|nr:hypothetical protein [Burkholderiaceae bacterium]